MAISIYNRKKQFIAPDVEALIKELTGFEDDEENYQKVSRFTYSNIIHHNFCTVDINVVQRSFNGIIEKFKLRGFVDRSQRLRYLVDKFISSKSTKFSQTVKWDILLLLLQLSYKPLSVTTTDDLKQNKDALVYTVEDEAINWSTYLKEGSEEFLCPSDNSDEEAALWASSSEEEEEETINDEPATGDSYVPQGFGCVPHPSLWRKKSPPPSRQEVIRKIIQKGVQAEKWLRSNVQNSWWVDPSCNTVPTSTYPPAYTCEKWEELVSSKQARNPKDRPQIQKLAEFCVLHEVLWMLNTPMDMRVFLAGSDGLFHVRSNISLPSTIPGSFRLYLTELCPYFDMMQRLRQFEELVWAVETSERPLPATYKAYCTMLFLQLHPLLHQLRSIEDRLDAQDETMTLVSVVDELTSSLNLLKYLHDIHINAVTELHATPNWICATRLLSVLYSAVVEATHHEHLNASLNLFMHSFHIYINIIDVWLSEGRLEDWGNEFLVTRENGVLEVMPYIEKMKECGVEPVPLLNKLVSVVRDAGLTIEVVKNLDKLTDLRDAVQNKGCLYKEFSENVYNAIKKLKEENNDKPVSPVNSEFVSANSSVNELLEKEKTETDKINQSEHPQEGDVENKEEDNLQNNEFNNTEDEKSINDQNTCNNNEITKLSLDDKMCERLCGLQVGKGEGEGEGQRDPRWYLQTLDSHAMYKQVMDRLLENPFLREGLRGVMGLPQRPVSPLQSTVPAPNITHSVGVVGLMSMHGVLERQLGLIVTRHQLASKIVTNTLRTEKKLLQHFTVLRHVFFMESGYLAQSFYSFLFEEIEAGANNYQFNLNVHIKTCVEECYPGFGDYFNFLLEGAKTSQDMHRAISFISLDYKVDWPISLIILEENIISYNKVFRFLLHIKYAFWTLRSLRFAELANSKFPQRCRRLQVLRHWLYHSINTLHSYFMGLVQRSFSKHLEQTILTADTVDAIKEAHSKFLEEAKVHCLQDKKSHVETFIMKLLRLCGAVATSWRQETVGGGEDTQILEQQYLQACHGLLYCLEAIAEEADPDNHLYELKCEIAHSMPEPYD